MLLLNMSENVLWKPVKFSLKTFPFTVQHKWPTGNSNVVTTTREKNNRILVQHIWLFNGSVESRSQLSVMLKLHSWSLFHVSVSGQLGCRVWCQLEEKWRWWDESELHRRESQDGNVHEFIKSLSICLHNRLKWKLHG